MINNCKKKNRTNLDCFLNQISQTPFLISILVSLMAKVTVVTALKIHNIYVCLGKQKGTQKERRDRGESIYPCCSGLPTIKKRKRKDKKKGRKGHKDFI